MGSQALKCTAPNEKRVEMLNICSDSTDHTRKEKDILRKERSMSNSPIVQELATNLRSSKAQLEAVGQQLDILERQEKLAQFTTKELESYPTDKVWRSCGKAFVLQDKSKYIEDLNHDEGVLKEQSKALGIKKNYLETTVEKIVHNLKIALEKQ